MDSAEKGGEDSLDVLTRRHGQLPDTVEAITGGGGRHLVFQYPAGKKIASGSNVLGAGLDIRAEGGYIVVEPSIHITGVAYAWEGSSDPLEGVQPTAAPTWLLNLIETSKGSHAASGGDTGWRMDASQALEVRQALGYIPADDYHTWIQVGKHSRRLQRDQQIESAISQRSRVVSVFSAGRLLIEQFDQDSQRNPQR